ncbi:hypothetical protein [Cellulomonas pakistanensis]|uniref:DUF4232 domain-containing protein n=1 Tax=Cellulomonas pakistanensis TaxID=992287 RepID=A0A919PD41_9CELL|nr:hypothetical protein [Cellulomonas pakistanensis]GIG37471.1 hypothetical protein Cpa01nite_28520 [Cellulomonas pakistanensis]
MGVLRPEGSLPPRVYWIRRTVVLLVLVLVVVLAVFGVRALTGGGGDDAAAPTDGTTVEQPTAEESEAGTPVCEPAAVGVQLAADATTYPAAALPTFTVTITNTGDVACLLDAGEAQRQVLVTSGSDRIWASTDCASGEALQLLLAPGQADERPVQWDRNRSVEGCAPDQPAAQPGTYQAVLTLAGTSTEPVVFGLE